MQYYDLAGTSNLGSSILKEIYIPLWISDDGYTSVSGITSAGEVIQDGSTSCTSYNGGLGKIFNLSSKWSPSEMFALEVNMYTSNASYNAYAVLWDYTASASVANSLCSTLSTASTIVRSGQFTLIAGRSYGVSIYNLGTPPTYLSSASLVAFGQ